MNNFLIEMIQERAYEEALELICISISNYLMAQQTPAKPSAKGAVAALSELPTEFSPIVLGNCYHIENLKAVNCISDQRQIHSEISQIPLKQ